MKKLLTNEDFNYEIDIDKYEGSSVSYNINLRVKTNEGLLYFELHYCKKACYEIYDLTFDTNLWCTWEVYPIVDLDDIREQVLKLHKKNTINQVHDDGKTFTLESAYEVESKKLRKFYDMCTNFGFNCDLGAIGKQRTMHFIDKTTNKWCSLQSNYNVRQHVITFKCSLNRLTRRPKLYYF